MGHTINSLGQDCPIWVGKQVCIHTHTPQTHVRYTVIVSAKMVLQQSSQGCRKLPDCLSETEPEGQFQNETGFLQL